MRNNRRQHRPHFGFLFIYYNFFFCPIFFLCFIVHLSGLNWNFESCFPPSPPFFALVSFWCNFWLLVCGTFWDLFLFHFSNCLHMFVRAVFTSLRFWPKFTFIYNLSSFRASRTHKHKESFSGPTLSEALGLSVRACVRLLLLRSTLNWALTMRWFSSYADVSFRFYTTRMTVCSVSKFL